MESQVTSLEMSKELKEAGFEVKTEFWWADMSDEKYTLTVLRGGELFSAHGSNFMEPLADDADDIPAYTFQQLGQWTLDHRINTARRGGTATLNKLYNKAKASFQPDDMARYILAVDKLLGIFNDR